jgi:CHAD domain-containing protein
VPPSRRLVLADPHARLGVDDEGVHQARVATRRLRADLRTFRSLLDETWVAEARDELRWVGGALGAVRDADVLTDRLARAVADLAPRDQPRARPLQQRLARQRADARQHLHEVLDSGRYLRLLDRLVEGTAAPPLIDGRDGPADEVLPDMVQGPWRQLRAGVGELDAEPEDAALHDVRILAKRLRYAAETVAPQVGKKARRLARAAARVQDVLGEHQDACVAEDWIRAAAAELTEPADAFVAGILAGGERARADALAASWWDEWARLDRKKVRGWL